MKKKNRLLGIVCLCLMQSCTKGYDVTLYPTKFCFDSSNKNFKKLEIQGFDYPIEFFPCSCNMVYVKWDTIAFNESNIKKDSLVFSYITKTKEYGFFIYEYDNNSLSISGRYSGLIPPNIWYRDSILLKVRQTN